MSWKLAYSDEARYQLKKMDGSVRRAIQKYMGDVCELQDPRSRGKTLESNLAGLQRYRVGDWRVVTEIQGKTVTILVVKIGHRSTVYE